MLRTTQKTLQLQFCRQPSMFGSRSGQKRLIFTVPPEVARLINPNQVFQITLRPMGSVHA